MKKISVITAILAALLCASTGCGAITYVADFIDSSVSAESGAASDTSGIVSETESTDENESLSFFESLFSNMSADTTVTAVASASYTASSSGLIDGSEEFTDRDLRQTADTDGAEYITVADGKTISITEEGVYVISGSASECTIRIEAASDAKVQLVLDGVTIENTDSPAIYVVSADKVFITSVGKNSLSVTGKFTADGSTNTDAVIFSRDDITLNGTGSLTVYSAYGNGVSGKDDIKLTGGTYNISAALDAIEANDSIRICGGDITINSKKDGLHAENDEDDSLGYVYIAGGKLTITASDDGIHAVAFVQIDDGEITINAYEGIEGTYIQINGGDITVTAQDDGVNAARKSGSYTPTFEMNGGELAVSVAQGDTDAIDSNGNVIVNGGTINITASMSSFDYDGTAQYNGGTIIINGQTVNSIPQSMMGGGMGGWNFGGNQGGWGGQAGGNWGGFGGWGRG